MALRPWRWSAGPGEVGGDCVGWGDPRQRDVVGVGSPEPELQPHPCLCRVAGGRPATTLIVFVSAPTGFWATQVYSPASCAVTRRSSSVPPRVHPVLAARPEPAVSLTPQESPSRSRARELDQRPAVQQQAVSAGHLEARGKLRGGDEEQAVVRHLPEGHLPHWGR